MPTDGMRALRLLPLLCSLLATSSARRPKYLASHTREISHLIGGQSHASHSTHPVGRQLSQARRLSKSNKSKNHLKSNKSAKSSKSSKWNQSSKSSKSNKSSKSSKSNKSPKKRKCKNSVRDNHVELKCSANDGHVKDKIDFRLSTGVKGVEIDVKYKRDDKSDINGEGAHTKTEEEYEIYFSSLVEYLPDWTSGNAPSLGFGWEEDEAVQTMDLSTWSPFSDIIKDEDGVLQFYVETKDGVAHFNFKLSEEGMEEPQLSANRIKVDVSLKDFPWKRNDTLVALLSTVEANTDLMTHYHTSKSHSGKSGKYSKKGKPRHPTEVQISFDNATLPFGEFVWVTSADVDNTTNTSEVVATSPPDDDDLEEGVQLIAFSFLNSSDASFIYWDPEAGVKYPSEGSFGTNEDSSGTSENSSGTVHMGRTRKLLLLLLSATTGTLLLGIAW